MTMVDEKLGTWRHNTVNPENSRLLSHVLGALCNERIYCMKTLAILKNPDIDEDGKSFWTFQTCQIRFSIEF